MELESLIGKHMDSQESHEANWNDHWPRVNIQGVITAIIPTDHIPKDAILIDGFDSEGKPIITDIKNGFEAILEVNHDN